MSHLSKQNWREILYKTSNIRLKLKIDSSKSLVTDNIIWNLKNQGMEVYSGLKSYKHKTTIKSKKSGVNFYDIVTREAEYITSKNK